MKLLRCGRRLHSVVGIDLGTTNSAVAVIEGRVPKIIENEGKRTTPLVVAFNNGVLVGYPAKQQALVNPANTFSATKRLIGRKFSDAEVQRDLKTTSYSIIEHSSGDAWVRTSTGTAYLPAQIGGFVLQEMKRVAAGYLADPPLRAVVTVPAYFNDSQRQATKSAGQMAGLEVLRVINEPTAAALAYGLDKRRAGVVAVFDFGGGTFDISILDIEDGVFEVRATNGDTHLGGEDFDAVLIDYILGKAGERGIDVGDKVAVQRVREAAEKAKIELSLVKETTISIPFLDGKQHLSFSLKEETLDDLTMHLMQRVVQPVQRCVRDAEIDFADVDEVLMVGGMTRMPRLRRLVAELFGKEVNTSVNPDEAVALGAAIQGGVLSGEVQDVVLLDVTPLTLGIETYGGIFSPLIPRNSAVPIKKELVFSTAVDGQTGVEVKVYQGERPLVKDNKMIGEFSLTGIPRSPKGMPQIAVSFAIDADGIINVSATDKTQYPKDLPHYGKANSVEIQVTSQTGEEEVEQMLKMSAENKQKDAESKALMEHAARTDILCSDAENIVALYGEMMEPEEKEAIAGAIASLRSRTEEIRGGGCPSVSQMTLDVNHLQTICMAAVKGVAKKQKTQT